MARGDFAKAFGEYRKTGGKLGRKEFADVIWRAKTVEEAREVIDNAEASSGGQVPQN